MKPIARPLLFALALLGPSAALAQAPQAQLSITSMTDTMPMNLLEGAYPPTPIGITHTLVVTNHGPDAVTGALVTDVASAVEWGAWWTCTASPGSSCSGGQGYQMIASANLLSGGTATFTVTEIFECCYFDVVANTARVQPPAGTFDPNPVDNERALYTYRLLPTGATGYYTTTPCRLLDTREAGGPFRGGETRNYVAAGQCGIPPDAQALMVNVTAAQPTDSGNLRLYPFGRWTSSSALNFAAGVNRANNAVVRLGRQGFGVHCDLLPQSAGSVHVVVDVYGWFR